MITRINLVAFFIAALISGPAFAQERENSENTSEGYQAVAVASRFEDNERDAVLRATVIRRRDIRESGARDLAELLEEQPAVQIARTFRGDSISLQGLDPEYTLILIDGDVAPGRVGGAIDLGRFTLEGIERVEILTGSASALYGSDAIGGLINIVPRLPERFELSLQGQGGYTLDAGGSGDLRGSVGSRIGNLRFRASGNGSVAPSISAGIGTALSSRLQMGGGVYAEYRFDSRWRLRVRSDYLYRELRGVDLSDTGAVFDRTQVSEQGQLSLGLNYRDGYGTELQARATGSVFREQFLSDQRNGTQLDVVNDNREDLLQLRTMARHSWDGHNIAVGYEQLLQELTSERLTRAGKRTRYSPFFQTEWLLWSERDASAAISTRVALVLGGRIDVDSQFGTEPSPVVGVRYDPVPELMLRANFGMGFRAPSFSELLLRFENPTVGYLVAGNPNLRPERSRSFALHADWRPQTDLSLHAGLFRTELDNMITTVTTETGVSGTVFSYANIQSAYTQGVELSGRYRVQDLESRLSYTLNDTRDNELQRPIEGRPLHRIAGSLRIHIQAIDMRVMGRAALSLDRQYFVGTPEQRVMPDALVQCDVRVEKTLIDELIVYVAGENLTHARDPYLALRPLTVMAGLELRLRESGDEE